MSRSRWRRVGSPKSKKMGRPSVSPPDGYLWPREWAKKRKCSETSVDNWTKEGRLPYLDVDGRKAIPVNAAVAPLHTVSLEEFANNVGLHHEAIMLLIKGGQIHYTRTEDPSDKKKLLYWIYTNQYEDFP